MTTIADAAVREILSRRTEHPITRDMVLLDLDDLDSLDVVEIAMELEERFEGFEIDDDDIEASFRTVGGIVDLVAARLGARS